MKNFWNSSQFEKSNAKSLKIAAKQLVFLYFWYLGTAKSTEKLTEKIENSSKTVSLHPFLNGWQQKNSGFTIFSENLFFFRNFWKKNWNSSQFEKSNAKSLKIAKQLIFLHFWYLGTAKNYEKLAEQFENSSKTASFHSFLNGWQQKISGFTFFSEEIFFSIWKFSEIRQNSRKATQKVWK